MPALPSENNEDGVDELRPGMTGLWLVTTQGSQHEWDLDSMTYMRVPGAASLSGPFALDSVRMPIARVERWPKVGSTSLVFFDDPARPFDREHFRQSSRIVSITRISDPEPGDGGLSFFDVRPDEDLGG